MKQVLHPNYVPRFCLYCGGRGFFLIEKKPDFPDKLVKSNETIECKFCGGSGDRYVTRP